MKTTEFGKFFRQAPIIVCSTLLTLSFPVLAQNHSAEQWGNSYSNSDLQAIAEDVLQNQNSQDWGDVPEDANTGAIETRTTCPKLNQELFLVHSPIGKTASSHPTFAWYVESPDRTEVDVEFRLYNATRDRLIHSETFHTKRGIKIYSLPKKVQDLSPDRSYAWQVSLFCNPDIPEEEEVSDLAYFQVVQMQPTLANRLANTSDRCEKIALYDEAGLGYDTLKEALSWGEEFYSTAIATFTQSEALKYLLPFNPEKQVSDPLPCL